MASKDDQIVALLLEIRNRLSGLEPRRGRFVLRMMEATTGIEPV